MEQKEAKIKIGILGGGQLAQMLIENSPFYDASFLVYSDALKCPAASTNAQIHVGKLNDTSQLKSFLKDVNFLTFENEFIDVEILNEVRKDFPKLFILPDLKLLQVLQNKLYQKFEFQKLNLPTSTFFAFNPELDNLDLWLEAAFLKLNSKMVIKWAFGGYDGKGNFIVADKAQLKEALQFCQKALAKNSTVYAEAFVPFTKEVAQVYVRSLKGEFVSYPLVISEQEKNVCRLVYGPATQFDVSSEVEERALEIGKILAEKLNYVGTFAVEYFLTEDGKLLINEMAPRVHNTGHYSLDACRENQFGQHIKAILGAKLTLPATYPFFAMRNLLGPIDVEKTFPLNTLEKLPKNEDIRVYWYNKTQVKPYRKMGHINTIAMTKDDLNRKIKMMKDTEEKLWSLL